MTPEGKIKAQVKAVLSRFPDLYSYWPVPAGYGPTGLDCYVGYRGRMIAIETKAPGHKLTPRQHYTKRELQAAGVRVFVIDGTINTDTVGELEAFLCDLLEGPPNGDETVGVSAGPSPAAGSHPG